MSILSDALKKADQGYRRLKKESVSSSKANNESFDDGFPWVKISIVIVIILILFAAGGAYWYTKDTAKTVGAIKAVKKQKIIPRVTIKKKPSTQKKVLKKQPKKAKAVVQIKPSQEEIKLIQERKTSVLRQQIFKQAFQAAQNNNVSEIKRLIESVNTQKVVYLPVAKRLGNALLTQNRTNLAGLILSQAHALYPRDRDVQLLLARTYFKENQYKKTITLLNSQQPELNTNKTYYELKALAYLKLKSYQEALLIYQSLAKVQHNDPKYAVGVAVSLQGVGDSKMALFAYQNALHLAPAGWPVTSYIQQQIRNLSP